VATVQPDNLVKLTMQFDLNNGSAVVDHAQFGVWGQFRNSGNPSDWNAALDDLCEFALAKWIDQVPTGLFSPAAHLNGAVAGHYDNLGRLVHERKKAVASTSDWVGGGTQSLPWQCTPCVSLYTYPRGDFVVHGKSRRGRIYLPPAAAGILGDAHSAMVTTGNCDNILNYVGGFFDELIAQTYSTTPSSWQPGVLSVVQNEFNILTQLSMDTKLDTQRRREKQLPATVRSVAWPLAGA
jgi:hypothetical protein